MTSVDLLCGTEVVRVDASLVEMSNERVFGARFAVPPARPPMLTVTRTTGLEGQVVEGPLGRALMKLEGDQLTVEVGEGQFLGELVLRLAWYIATTRQGGVLIHASCVRKGDVALVACGKSGDGKSTLARLAVGAGLTLMTDEVVMLFPDGRVGGTPFRSDADNPGSPGVARCRNFVALEKAPVEQLKPLAARDATHLVISQCFDVEVVRIARAEQHRRLLGFLASVQLGTLAFRKDPEAGRFVASLLE